MLFPSATARRLSSPSTAASAPARCASLLSLADLSTTRETATATRTKISSARTFSGSITVQRSDGPDAEIVHGQPCQHGGRTAGQSPPSSATATMPVSWTSMSVDSWLCGSRSRLNCRSGGSARARMNAEAARRGRPVPRLCVSAARFLPDEVHVEGARVS